MFAVEALKNLRTQGKSSNIDFRSWHSVLNIFHNSFLAGTHTERKRSQNRIHYSLWTDIISNKFIMLIHWDEEAELAEKKDYLRWLRRWRRRHLFTGYLKTPLLCFCCVNKETLILLNGFSQNKLSSTCTSTTWDPLSRLHKFAQLESSRKMQYLRLHLIKKICDRVDRTCHRRVFSPGTEGFDFNLRQIWNE